LISKELASKMYIFVRHTTGRTFTISVEAETTVRELKKQLEVESELPVEQQELTFCEKPLRNEDTMLDCDIGSEAIVKLSFVPLASFSSSSSSSSSHSRTKAFDGLLEEFDFPIDDYGTGKEPEEPEGDGLFSSLLNFDFDSFSSLPGKPKYQKKAAGRKKPRPPPEEKVFIIYNTKEQTFVSAVLNLALKVLFTSVRKSYLWFTSCLSFSQNSVFLPILRRARSFIVFLRYSKLIVTLIFLFSKTFVFISKSSSFLWNKVSRASSFLWSSLSSVSSFIWKRLCTFTSLLWNKVCRFSFFIWYHLSSTTSFIWRKLTKVGSFFWNKLFNIVSFFSRIISSAWHHFSKACSFLYSKFTSTVSYISTKVSRTTSSIWRAISFLLTKVSKAVSSVWNSLSKMCNFISKNVKSAVSRTTRKFATILLLGLKSLKNFGVKSFNGINSCLFAPIRKSLHFVFIRVPTASVKLVERTINCCVDFTKQNVVLPAWKAYGILNRALEAAFTSTGKEITNYVFKPTIRGITNLGVGIKNAAIECGKVSFLCFLTCDLHLTSFLPY
jgi:hypothetical protein